MAIKLIAIDIDGTLLDSQKQLSSKNKEAIQAARNQGVKIVLCTGRPLRSMAYLIQELNLNGEEDLAVTYNGALIQYTQSGHALTENHLDQGDALSIYNLLSEMNLPTNFISYDYIYEPAYPEGRPSIYQIEKKIERRPEDLIFKAVRAENLPKDFKPIKVVSSRPAAELDEMISKIPQSFYDQFTIFKSQPTILEFMPKGINKGFGMMTIGKHLGLNSDEMMGIGDQENDLSLITEAGIGVAMDNAIPSVKQAANYVTKSNDEDGVAHAINHFILGK